jgi:DNA-binding NtrC family response regulator
VREQTFREDLLFRLNVVNLKIPPLREWPADVLELAQYFICKYAAANGLPARPHLRSASASRAVYRKGISSRNPACSCAQSISW